MTAHTQGDERKLRELILYISQRCANDPTFGAIKLNKTLCFSDFFFYGYKQRGITGVEYQKLPNGPAPRRLLPVRQEMMDSGELVIQEVPLQSGFVQKRPVNLRAPDLSVFTGEEIALVDSVIDSLREVNAEATSEMSHNMVGWLVADENEVIPYNTAYFLNPPLTDDERLRASELNAAKGRGKRTQGKIHAA